MVGRLLGLDYGERRIGVAVSDPTGTIASPLTTIEYRGQTGVAEVLDDLVDLVQNETVIGVVIGDPRHLSGKRGASSAAAEKLARALAARLGSHPVWLWDERLSSVAAEAALREGGMRGRARRARVDQVAAALILQSFLDAYREGPPPPGVTPAAGEEGLPAG
jgi:putative Holliday junction resolvase